MKKILITGSDSYIGTSFEKWLNNKPNQYLIETIDMKAENWDKRDFSGYDVVFHVAGIAHVSTDRKLEQLYYSVNRDLALKVAEKSKNDGVEQFIFMSSIIVYGSTKDRYKIIDSKTNPSPDNFYG